MIPQPPRAFLSRAKQRLLLRSLKLKGAGDSEVARLRGNRRNIREYRRKGDQFNQLGMNARAEREYRV